MSQQESKIHGFTPAQVLDIFSCDDLDSRVVSEWVYSRLHPNPIVSCPACGSTSLTHRQITTFREGGRVKCPTCNKFFTNRTNTILHGTQLAFDQVYLIAALVAFADRAGADPIRARREIARIIGLHPDSIKNWQDIFSALELPCPQ